LAQPERARERYAEALRLAPRGTPERKWEIRILHRMADLDMQRLDWNAAIRDYEQITEISPGDERAHLGLLRLYTRVGRVQRGIAALDRLIRRYLETRRVEKAVAILEDLVQEEPASIPLRFRAARLCLSAGKREQALEHLDILGDLQLQAGQDEAALKTIENILSLNPENVEGYMELYRDLGGRTPPKPAE
jgi:tetratricopeptide (TPR) repeat protein